MVRETIVWKECARKDLTILCLRTPKKRNEGSERFVVPPNSMAGGLFCILFKAQDDEAKTVVKTDSTGEFICCLVQSPRQ